MSNIIINGETYENIETISANTPDGGIATFLNEENISTKQDKIDENLNTESKEIVGAINELKKSVDEKTISYRHTVTFKFYNISDNWVIDEGTLIILSNSKTLIDTEELGVQGAVEELRKYIGQAVFADCTVGRGVTSIGDFYNDGTLSVTIGENTAIIYTPSDIESTTLTDIIT